MTAAKKATAKKPMAKKPTAKTAPKAAPKKVAARKPTVKRVVCGLACKVHVGGACDMEKGHGGMHSHIRGQGMGQSFHIYRSGS